MKLKNIVSLKSLITLKNLKPDQETKRKNTNNHIKN